MKDGGIDLDFGWISRLNTNAKIAGVLFVIAKILFLSTAITILVGAYGWALINISLYTCSIIGCLVFGFMSHREMHREMVFITVSGEKHKVTKEKYEKIKDFLK